ncbi:beta-lactamase-like protein [Aspergillus heterothallicus]
MPGSVTIHVLDAGHLTLPEAFFITPLDSQTARKTVPSLSFLIQHTDSQTFKTTRIVFDLGIRKRLTDYAPPIYKHAMTRQPLSGDPDTVASLAAGGLSPSDIDIVMLSHLHWDHVGTPEDYPGSSFVIGPGAGNLINGKQQVMGGSHSHFEEGLLDPSRTIELRSPHPDAGNASGRPLLVVESLEKQSLKPSTSVHARDLFSNAWKPIGPFPHGMDILGDGSVYIISAPGHLDGHVNLLCRRRDGKYFYLAGDACHDARLLSGEKQIATWNDPEYPNTVCCIHSDKAMAEATLRRIRKAMSGITDLGEVEVIFAHDDVWAKKARLLGWYFPGSM